MLRSKDHLQGATLFLAKVKFLKHSLISAVVKVLCYKLEGRRFDPSWCHWNFSLT
jgi:hypothetical protein